MQLISSHLHECNYYCDSDNNIHGIIIITHKGRSQEQIESQLRDNIGSDFISMKPAPEITLEEARKQVHYKPGNHNEVYLLICKGRRF